jgi:O-antigen/teichoic acid export membrane protein
MSIAKLAALPVLTVVVDAGSEAILASWVAGAALSMVAIALVRDSRDAPDDDGTEAPLMTTSRARLALLHHVFNLVLIAPALLLPVVAAVTLTSDESGYFYIAFTIAGLLLAVPASFAVALFAHGSRSPSMFSARLRLALRVSLGVSAAAALLMVPLASPLLSLFGTGYASEAAFTLQVLTLAAFPVTISSMYVPIVRLERTFVRGTLLMVVSTVLGLGLAAVGGATGGMVGFAVGWLAGTVIGQIPMLPVVLSATRGADDALVPPSTGREDDLVVITGEAVGFPSPADEAAPARTPSP